MNAIVVEQYGGIDKLVAKQVEKPAPGELDILVRYAIAFKTPNYLPSNRDLS